MPRAGPVARYFAGRGFDRVQLAFLGLYLVGAIHLSFFSLSTDRVSNRYELLATWIPMLLPILLVDGEFHRRRSVRLFVWPSSGLAGLFIGYSLARVGRAIVIAVVLALISLNTILAADVGTLATLGACAGLATYAASFIMFWNVLLGARSAYPAIYAAFFAMLWVLSRLVHKPELVGIAQWVLVPVWLLDPVNAAANMNDPIRLLQIISATTVWMVATWLVLHRSYR